ncbi:MAG: CHAT domain-containing protein [Chloroflexi bacterium]|nr:CHAT domain-containing protein [Chloroflexota bacterium]
MAPGSGATRTTRGGWPTSGRGGAAEGYARALRAQGHALRFLGMFETAIVQYEDAEARFRDLGLEHEAARTQIGHVTGLRLLGRYREAVELAQQTRAYFRDRGDELQAAKQANNLGTIYRPMGRLTAALTAYREARTVFRRLGERADLGDVELNIGNVLVELGRYEQAIKQLRQAERLYRSLDLDTRVALALLNIGVLSHKRGDYGRALEALTESRRTYEARGVEQGVTTVDRHLLLTYTALNLREESQAAADRAIGGLRALEMPFELGEALLAAGALAEVVGERDLARERTDEARQVFVRTGNRVWEATARLQQARLLAAATDPGELRLALRECQVATRRLHAAGALDQAAFGRLVEGKVLGRLDAAQAALACFRQVLDAATALGADHLLYQVHAAIAELLEPTAPESAVASYRLAIDHLEALRARALADDLKLSFLADKTDLYERIVGLLMQRGSALAVAEAFEFVERSKSRTLLEELLAGDGQTRPNTDGSRVATLARRVRDIRTRLNSAYHVAYETDQTPSSATVGQSGQAELVARLEQEFGRATRELQLAARAERVGPLADAGPAVPTAPAGTAIVEFYAVGETLLAFVVVGGELRLRRLGTLGDVRRLTDRLGFQLGKAAFGAEYLRANLETERRGIDRCLHALWEEVVAPLEADLVGLDRLVVVPHGPLHGLPFHAFHDGERYLAERFSVTYAPSVGVYQRCLTVARPLGGRALVVGVDDPGLPWVREEVETVARAWPEATVLTGPRATIKALRRQAGTIDALHLATHAVFRADNPTFSSVKLADAWLTVADLAELARGAQMVTLSACETGLGGLTVGDEVLGLTRGILGAGCPTVVASLWPVSDETTALLMGRFYQELQNGAEPSTALRSAMVALRAQHDHPYFWAPFVVMGSGQTADERSDG